MLLVLTNRFTLKDDCQGPRGDADGMSENNIDLARTDDLTDCKSVISKH